MRVRDHLIPSGGGVSIPQSSREVANDTHTLRATNERGASRKVWKKVLRPFMLALLRALATWTV